MPAFGLSKLQMDAAGMAASVLAALAAATSNTIRPWALKNGIAAVRLALLFVDTQIPPEMRGLAKTALIGVVFSAVAGLPSWVFYRFYQQLWPGCATQREHLSNFL